MLGAIAALYFFASTSDKILNVSCITKYKSFAYIKVIELRFATMMNK
jgi:hypothetical protein